MEKRFRSIVVWGADCPVETSVDRHYTMNGAISVCQYLVDKGFGGDGKHFPTHAMVEKMLDEDTTLWQQIVSIFEHGTMGNIVWRS